MLAPLQEIINSTSDRLTRGQLDYVQRNTNLLLDQVNQFVNYRRAELGVCGFKVNKVIAHRLFEDIVLLL